MAWDGGVKGHPAGRQKRCASNAPCAGRGRDGGRGRTGPRLVLRSAAPLPKTDKAENTAAHCTAFHLPFFWLCRLCRSQRPMCQEASQTQTPRRPPENRVGRWSCWALGMELCLWRSKAHFPALVSQIQSPWDGPTRNSNSNRQLWGTCRHSWCFEEEGETWPGGGGDRQSQRNTFRTVPYRDKPPHREVDTP